MGTTLSWGCHYGKIRQFPNICQFLKQVEQTSLNCVNVHVWTQYGDTNVAVLIPTSCQNVHVWTHYLEA